MAMFLGEISFLLALAVFAFGLVLWHRGREAAAGPLRGAGAVLVVGAVLTALCTGYYTVRYQTQGDFDHAYAPHPMGACAMMGPGGAPGSQRGMGPGVMGPGHMGPGTMGPGMMGPGAQAMPTRPGEGPAETAPPALEEYHPEPGEEN